MDIVTIAMYGGGLILALILLKFVIRIPIMLFKYAVLAALAYGAYLFATGGM